ncbi:MAG: ATP synthase F1 subunit gamma [Armatimonadetes bacterium]|nr:ATP synthase F1 subunit gamma [Armatimonadota bacterium]
MAGVREIKGRIRSVKNIQQITKAMKMVAAARIKKVETRMKASRPYAYKMREVVGELTSQLKGALHPLMQVRPTKKVGLVVVTADKGLCGSYNNNLVKLAFNWLRKLPAGLETELITVGGKGYRFFLKRNAHIVKEYLGWNPEYALARALAQQVSQDFIDGKVDEVHCVYTRVLSAMSQEATVVKILPFTNEGAEGPTRQLDYIFEPDPATALVTILPRYLEVIFFQILLEARTAELGARLRAMSNATDNASKLVGDLTLDFFRARQAAITNEILEVAGGAEALKK